MLDLTESKVYEFEDFRLDAKSHRLFRRETGETVPLQPKAADLLLALIENRGRLLTKDELIEKVWNGAFVEESNIAQTVFVLRKALGDSKKDPRYILTVPQRGYQFIAAVSEVHAGDEILDAPYLSEAAPDRVQPRRARSAAKVAFVILPLLIVAALAAYWLYPRDASPGKIRTIAVLPFEDLSEQHADRYLGISLADALAKQFGGLKTITVRPIQSVLKYSSGRTDYQAVGSELQADAVLEGRIQRSGDRLRVNVQLIRVADNATVWSSNFDDAFTNFFAVQDSISKQVASSIALRMDEREQKRFEKRGTANTEAYQAYLRGRYFWNKRSPDNLQKAITEFDAAIEKDAGYALAYTGLADCYQLLAEYFVAPPEEAFPKARAAAARALELDDSMAEAHTSMAYTQAFYDWDWAAADRSFKRALELDPRYATAHHWYSEYLEAMGRFDEAREHLDRAREIDPSSLILRAGVAGLHHMQRDFDGAIDESKKIIEIDPTFAYGYYFLGASSARKGMHPEAVDAYAHLLTLFGEPADAIKDLNATYERSGWHAYQVKRMQQIETLPHLRNMPSFNRAFVYTEAGDKESALRELQRSVDRHERLVIYIKYTPDFDPLRSDPRFVRLVEQLHL